MGWGGQEGVEVEVRVAVVMLRDRSGGGLDTFAFGESILQCHHQFR